MDLLTVFVSLVLVPFASLVIYIIMYCPNFWRDVRILRTATKLIKIMDPKSENFLVAFGRVVKGMANKPAMIHAITNEQITFRELDERSNQVANWAISVGLAEGQTVALLALNTPDFVVWWLGFVKAGLRVAFLNFNLRGRSLVHCISVSHASALVVLADADGKLLTTAEEVFPQCEPDETLGKPLSFYSLGGDSPSATRIDDALKEQPLDVVTEERTVSPTPDPMLYVYTSGTTGLPKAAVIRENKFRGYAAVFQYYYRMKSDEKIYVCLPLYHSNSGLLGVGTMLFTGVTLVVRPKFSASAFWSDIKRHQCTSFQYVGELCRFLLAQPESDLDKSHGCVKGMGNGLRPDVWDKFVDRFGVWCGEFYGATEGNVAFFNFMGVRHSVGFLPWLARRMNKILFLRYDPDIGEPIRDEKTGLCIQAPPGEPGLLVAQISKELPFAGYSNKKETQKKIMTDVLKKGDQWMNTGDLLSYDKDGCVFFHDRAGDTFRWKSENVSTTEVSETITMFPSVSECTVYGVAVTHCDGRAGMAALTLNEGDELDGKALLTFLEKELPPYAQPVFLRVQPQLTLTNTFKYSKVQLVKDAYSPSSVSDPLFYRDSVSASYCQLTAEIYEKIQAEQIRL